MDQPSTSEVKDDEDKIDPATIGSGTTKLLRRILWKLELEKKSNTSGFLLSDPIPRTARYTGIHKDTIQKILAFGDTIEIKYSDIDRELIRKALHNACIHKNYIPTVTELFIAVYKLLPKYIDMEYFRTMIIKMGFVFYKFPGKQSLYILEKKSVIFERFKYIKAIQHYREMNAQIYYIGVGSINRYNEFLNLDMSLQTPDTMIFQYFFFVVNSNRVEYDVALTHSMTHADLIGNFQDWLLNFVLHDLPRHSIIVLEDSKIFREATIDVPTWKSVKVDMVEWLEYHNIPCVIDMPKSELLDLIETCTDTKQNTFVIDNLVKTFSHTMLRLPRCINGISIAAVVVRYLNDSKYLKTHGLHNINIFKEISNELINKFSDTVVTAEGLVLQEDLQMDNALDKLVRDTKISNKIDGVDNEDDSVLPYLSDSD